MNSPEELQTTALQEFEVVFGDIIRELDRDGLFYKHFQEEFLQGVRYGLAAQHTTRADIELEGELRMMSSPLADAQASVAEQKTAKCGQLAFMYGAGWATNLKNNSQS